MSRYVDLSMQIKTPTINPLSEKLLLHQSSVHFYDTLDHSFTNASIESVLWQPLSLALSSAGTAFTVKLACLTLWTLILFVSELFLQETVNATN